MQNARLPVTIISGFLGSGKSTVLNALLRNPELSDTAVIVNEFGEIGLDHLLVESALDEMILLDNGCLCCSVRGDLADTLADLLRRVNEGRIPRFQRVMVETTGLADPAPIVKTLISHEATAARYVPSHIVTTVDAVTGLDTLKQCREARSQVAMADLLIVTKSDMAEADVPNVSRAARSLNPNAAIEIADRGEIDPTLLFDDRSQIDIAALCSGIAPDGSETPHLWDIRSVSIVLEAALPWSALTAWLEWLVSMRGPDILRIKGLLRVQGYDGPVLVQGVQHVFHTPVALPEWPDDDQRSRIVIIARDIPETALRESLAKFEAQANS